MIHGDGDSNKHIFPKYCPNFQATQRAAEFQEHMDGHLAKRNHLSRYLFTQNTGADDTSAKPKIRKC